MVFVHAARRRPKGRLRCRYMAVFCVGFKAKRLTKLRSPEPGYKAKSRRHSHRGEQVGTGLGAGRADGGAKLTMLVHRSMPLAFGRASAAKRNASGELRFQKLPVPNLVGSGHDSGRGSANRSAIQVEANARGQPFDVFFGQAGIGAGGADFQARETGIDTLAQNVRMARSFRM